MSPFDPARASYLARFVDVAYAMYGNGHGASLHPPLPKTGLPDGYRLTSYITMRNEVNNAASRVFFGYIATADHAPTIVAIRGTVGGIEWIKDAEVWPPLTFDPVPDSGHVVKGFADFYRTLVVSDASADRVAPAVADLDRQAPVNGGLRFAAQVSSAVARRGGDVSPKGPAIIVVGHSLGGALVTLYVLDNAANERMNVHGAYTLASPHVGNQDFVNAYNQTCARDTIDSYRIVNHADLVPTLPLEVVGWRHVDSAIEVDSHDTVFTIAHAHALSTYEMLLKKMPAPATPVSATAGLHT